MKEPILISFIIPVYNGEQYIGRCLKSVCSQTYKNIEVIVVDDGSNDKTLDIIKKYAILDNRITYYSKENSGVSATRNFALQKVRGEYIFFVDADDWIEPTVAENNLKIMIQRNVDITINDFYCNRVDSVSKVATFSKSRGYVEIENIKRTLIASDNLNSQCISLYSMDIIREHKIEFPEDIRCGEDNIFNLTYVNYVKRAFYTQEAFYHYEIHKNSGCRHLHDNQLNMYDKQFKIKQYYGERWDVLDSLTIIDWLQLIGTHFAAYALMAQREKKV